MKKIILTLLSVSACLVGCDSKVKVSPENNISDGMLIVHRVVTSSSYHGNCIRVNIRDKSGDEIYISDYPHQLGDLKYVQPGDTVYFRRTTNDPEILRIGFKD